MKSKWKKDVTYRIWTRPIRGYILQIRNDVDKEYYWYIYEKNDRVLQGVINPGSFKMAQQECEKELRQHLTHKINQLDSVRIEI